MVWLSSEISFQFFLNQLFSVLIFQLLGNPQLIPPSEISERKVTLIYINLKDLYAKLLIDLSGLTT